MTIARRIAGRMLADVVAEVRASGYAQPSLETGSQPFFAPAHALYEKHGFSACGPCGTYIDDPNSRFMTRML